MILPSLLSCSPPLLSSLDYSLSSPHLLPPLLCCPLACPVWHRFQTICFYIFIPLLFVFFFARVPFFSVKVLFPAAVVDFLWNAYIRIRMRTATLEQGFGCTLWIFIQPFWLLHFADNVGKIHMWNSIGFKFQMMGDSTAYLSDIYIHGTKRSVLYFWTGQRLHSGWGGFHRS